MAFAIQQALCIGPGARKFFKFDGFLLKKISTSLSSSQLSFDLAAAVHRK